MKFLRYSWFTINAIGYATLWIAYYFPTEWGNKRNVARSARQWKNRHVIAPIVTFCWILILLVLLLGDSGQT